MASREFLKILQSARMGDVSAQQNLASAYLTGAFKTPIQPANALIWLEKSFLSIQNQALSQSNANEVSIGSIDKLNPGVLQILEQISAVPLEFVLNSPAFAFGWESFWKLSQLHIPQSDAAKWQLAQLLLDPEKKELQAVLEAWLSSDRIPIRGLALK